MKFPDYMAQLCAKYNIEFIKGDMNHLVKMLYYIPYDRRKDVIHRYIEIWHQTMAECESELLGMNLGRRTSNMWLIEVCNEGRKNNIE